MRRIEPIACGYLKRRMPEIVASLQSFNEQKPISFDRAKDSIFKEIAAYKCECDKISQENENPFSPAFLRKNPISDTASILVHEFVVGKRNAGNTLSAILDQIVVSENDRKACIALLPLCVGDENKNGPISVLKSEQMKGYLSAARKIIFFSDFVEYGPNIQ